MNVSSNWIFIIPGLLIYFVPTIAAALRSSEKALGIFLLNLFLGFSVIGWAVALVWAFTSKTVSTEAMRPCPYCRTEISLLAMVCQQCRRDVFAPATTSFERSDRSQQFPKE
jgi:hypothetical protein